MKNSCELIIPKSIFDSLYEHLFPGDRDEHAAVILAGVSEVNGKVRLLARELYLAEDGTDHVDGQYGYKMIRAQFIRPLIRIAREERLAYIGIHNHGGWDSVCFSQDDIDSHERGHPALLDLAEGMPVGAVVLAPHAVAGDIWLPDGRRLALNETRVIGANIRHLYPQPKPKPAGTSIYDRQEQMFGKAGQDMLKEAKIGVIGAGGVGSMVVEYLARLGVGSMVVVDPDRIDYSNLSRVVGSSISDVKPQHAEVSTGTFPLRKVDIAKRVATEANPDIEFLGIDGDFSHDDVARQFLDCDFMFLAADSMRARLVFNAIVQQYYIPGIQIGSLISPDKTGHSLESVFSITRWVVPEVGCLWCSNTIDRHQLALESKSDIERHDQDYGTGQVNPSVVTVNAVGASIAVNDFLFSYLGLFSNEVQPAPRRVHHLERRVADQLLELDSNCKECSKDKTSRLGRGDGALLPTVRKV